MTRKRDSDDVEINIENILEEFTNDFEDTYTELHKFLKEESRYKRLKRVGEEEFYKAHNSVVGMESQNTRLSYAKINLLVHEVCDTMGTIIRKKFQGEFLDTMKDKVLQTVLKLYTQQKTDTPEASEDDIDLSQLGSSGSEQKKNYEKLLLEKLNDLSKLYADNLIDIKKQVIEMPLEETQSGASENPTETVSDVIKKDTLSNDKTDEGNNSFVSFSSAHTSELSSFDDSIVFSSDEETGEKQKRMSSRAVQERLAELKAELAAVEGDSQNLSQLSETTEQDNAEKPDIPVNDSPAQKSFSQRVRKPNSKYATDILLPLRRTSTEKVSTPNSTSSVDSSLPRKRGRPRIHLR